MPQKIYWSLLGFMLSIPCLASPTSNADPAFGKMLYSEQNCSRCHIQQFGGDGSKIYLREDRRVKSLKQLVSQVSFCSTQLKTNWFPEEEEHVAAYLNSEYYRFK